MTEALTAALRDRGYAVDVTRGVDTFAHLDVTSPGGGAMAVELAVDARIRDTVQLVLATARGAHAGQVCVSPMPSS
jgi:hypothetical protein